MDSECSKNQDVYHTLFHLTFATDPRGGAGGENVVVVKVADKTEEADEETCLCSPVNAKALSVSPLLFLNSVRYPTYSVG